MKSKKLLLVIIALVGFIFTSCKKDEVDNTPKFSTLTIEENKASIENNGFELLNNIREFETCPSIRAAKNMVNYLSKGDVFGANPILNTSYKATKSIDLLNPIFTVAGMDKFDAKSVAKNMMEVNPDTIEALFNTLKGLYSWNSETGEWEYTSSTKELRIEFPSTNSGTTNNVVYRIYDCTFGSWGISEINLPKQVKVELTVNNDVLISYIFKITVDKELGIPSSLLSELTLSPFTFSLEANIKELSSGSISYRWSKNGTTLMKIAVSASTTSDGSDVKKGNFTFQLMNIKLTGDANINEINNQMDQIDYDNLSDSVVVAKKCEIFNTNSKLNLCYADNSRVIATVVSYSEPFYEWNDNIGEYEKSYDIGFRFVFADDSSVDFKTYFSEGFDSLAEEFVFYVKELYNKYNPR